MSIERKPFSEVFGESGKTREPLVKLRRLTAEDIKEHQVTETGTMVGVFWERELLAIVDFDDLFDAEGNRFYND